MNFSFIGGSMGSVVGEKVARLIDYAHENNLPLILICASGGARMQEGVLSLMQLAKISSKLAQFSEGGGLYIPILTDPTTGGVTASYGMLGDIILAEPGALIGFAGPRVIKQTIGQDLPEGFQRTEFLKEKGFVDHIVTRDKMKATLYSLISMLK
jgi:acetyl-CoA carboxylase carboxyl transferase beta subunit